MSELRSIRYFVRCGIIIYIVTIYFPYLGCYNPHISAALLSDLLQMSVLFCCCCRCCCCFYELSYKLLKMTPQEDQRLKSSYYDNLDDWLINWLVDTLIGWLIDFNGISIRLGLFYALKFRNFVHYAFIFTCFVYCF